MELADLCQSNLLISKKALAVRRLYHEDPSNPAIRSLLGDLVQLIEVHRHNYFLNVNAGKQVPFGDALFNYVTSGYAKGFRDRWNRLEETSPIPVIAVLHAPDIETLHSYFGDYLPNVETRLQPGDGTFLDHKNDSRYSRAA